MLPLMYQEVIFLFEEETFRSQNTAICVFSTNPQTLTLNVPIPDKNKKSNLNFYCHTSLWRLKRFYEGFYSVKKN